MSFSPSSSSFIINGGTFTSISLPTHDAGQSLFPFQSLLLTVLLITAAAPAQVLWRRKDRDSCESDDYAQPEADDFRKRSQCKSLETLDGLMVCQQATWAMVILFYDDSLVIDRKGRRIRPA